MAMKTETAPKRTEVKDIPKSKRELTGKDLKKIKGGFEPVNDLRIPKVRLNFAQSYLSLAGC